MAPGIACQIARTRVELNYQIVWHDVEAGLVELSDSNVGLSVKEKCEKVVNEPVRL